MQSFLFSDGSRLFHPRNMFVFDAQLLCICLHRLSSNAYAKLGYFFDFL